MSFSPPFEYQSFTSSLIGRASSPSSFTSLSSFWSIQCCESHPVLSSCSLFFPDFYWLHFRFPPKDLEPAASWSREWSSWQEGWDWVPLKDFSWQIYSSQHHFFPLPQMNLRHLKTEMVTEPAQTLWLGWRHSSHTRAKAVRAQKFPQPSSAVLHQPWLLLWAGEGLKFWSSISPSWIWPRSSILSSEGGIWHLQTRWREWDRAQSSLADPGKDHFTRRKMKV